MRSWIRKIENEFLRNVLLMLSGNGLAIVIPFLVAPLISRIYSPEDFAVYELFVKILMLVAVIGSLRYELAIILPKKDSDSQIIIRLCFKLLLWISILSIAFIPFRRVIGDVFDNAQLSSLLWLLPLSILLVGAYSVLIQVAMRLRRFTLMSTNKVFASAGNHLSKYGLGLLSASPLSLILAHILGFILPLIGLLSNSRVRKFAFDSLKKSGSTAEIARQYKDFPIYNGTHAFYDEAYRTFIFFVISVGFGDLILGLFAFAFRYLRIPVQILGGALSQVLSPRLSTMKNDGQNLRPPILRSVLSFSAIGILPFGILFLYGAEIFSFVFSAEWTLAGRFAQIMAPWLFMNFIISPLSTLPSIVGKQKLFFYINVLSTLLILGSIFITYQLGFDFETVLIVFTGGNVLLNLVLIFWFLYIAESRISNK